jgi:hypothetical protein
MSRKLERDRVRAELADLEALLSRLPANSLTMLGAYEARKEELARLIHAAQLQRGLRAA